MENRHTIQKQVLEIQTADPSAKLGFEREVRDIYLDLLLPKMESLFDRYGRPGSRIRAEKLEIHVTLPWTKEWRDRFCDAVLQELEAGLRSAVQTDMSSPEIRGFTETKGDEQEALLYFLSNGTLPWYAGDLADMKKYIRRVLSGEAPSWGHQHEPGSFWNRIVRLLSEDTAAVRRWILQLGEDTLTRTFEDTPEFKIVVKWTGRLLPLYGAEYTPARWTVIFSFLASRVDIGGINERSGRTEADIFRMLWSILPEQLRQIWWKEECSIGTRMEIATLLKMETMAEKDILQIPSSEGDLQKKKNGSRRRLEDEGIFVDNAGIVLLHPFLTPLFTALGYWDGSRFASPHLHQRAVILTQCMIYPAGLDPAIGFPEHQLLLNKVLCGYEPEETLPSELICTEREITEMNDLLEAVIGHWKMNGRPVFTTVENLRASFLQRTGKLSRKSSGNWLLQVEGKGYDIVLNGLPWGIGMIKHPWMPDMLRVEWGQS